MKKYFPNLRRQDWFFAALLLISAALAYLLFVRRLGFYGDDWYIIFDAHTQGPDFLRTVYASDRPARAYLLGLMYRLFGDQVIYYNLSAFFFRYLSALAFYWTLNRVWAGRKTTHFLMALFFLIYPGFLNQLQPVDYQSQIVSLGLVMLSIALTVEAVRTKSLLWKILFTAAAILTGAAYLLLVEYLVGMEFLRLFFVGVLVWQETGRTWKWKTLRTLWRWLPSAVVPIGFLVWRVFFFQSTRVATDVGLQLGEFFAAPLSVGLRWLVATLYSLVYTVFGVWVVPFDKYLMEGQLGPGSTLLILGIAVGVAVLILVALYLRRKDAEAERVELNWVPAALVGGIVAVLVAVAPVVMVNRVAGFADSRYTLAGAPGAVMFLVAALSLLASSRLRNVLVGVLVFLALSTHLAVAVDAVGQADSLRSFWWQVSWRAPSIEAGTDLVADYSLMKTPESYVIWSPANLIYYPEKQHVEPIEVRLPASILSEETVTNILGGGNGRDVNHRGNRVREDFTALLVMTQPTTSSCVRILDGAMPELSPLDSPEVLLVAPYSLIGNVNGADSSPVPPEAIFGPEPEHTWCYFYEKAALAAQMEDWQTVLDLGEQAAQQGMKPADPVEWMPFLRAEVATGNVDALAAYVDTMKSDALIYRETCQILSETAADSRPTDTDMQAFIIKNFCH